MIHIIGTAHERTQMWSDAIRNGESCDTDSATVEKFRQYLHDQAISLGATAIAEELSKQVVDDREGGMSVAKQVADDIRLHHLYCDPDRDERKKLGITLETDCSVREAIWLSRVKSLSPNETSIIFVCGANHSSTFNSTLERSGIQARIHCSDWTLNQTLGVR